MRSQLVFWFLILLTPVAFADGLNDLRLRIKPYADLQFPVAKTEVQWMVQKAADALYDRAYVDLGDLTDFMHGHLYTPPGDSAPLLIIFHTKEYDNFRGVVPYLTTAGAELDHKLDRSWLLWLRDNPLGRRGEVIDPHRISALADHPELPVSPFDLDPAKIGADVSVGETSIYFFRVSCEYEETADNNLFSVEQGPAHERVCLALIDYHCRNHAYDDAATCGTTNVIPNLRPSWAVPKS